jgi:hypothetical protein
MSTSVRPFAKHPVLTARYWNVKDKILIAKLAIVMGMVSGVKNFWLVMSTFSSL